MLSVTSPYSLEWLASSTGNMGRCAVDFPIVTASPFEILNYVTAGNSKLWVGSAVVIACAQILNYTFLVLYILARHFEPPVSITHPSLFVFIALLKALPVWWASRAAGGQSSSLHIVLNTNKYIYIALWCVIIVQTCEVWPLPCRSRWLVRQCTPRIACLSLFPCI